MRIRIRVDVRKPFKRNKKIVKKDGKKFIACMKGLEIFVSRVVWLPPHIGFAESLLT